MTRPLKSLIVKLIILATGSTQLESNQKSKPLGLEHKYLVQIRVQFYPFKTTKEFKYCTGTILNARWIITAKYCLQKEGYDVVQAHVIRHMDEVLRKPISYSAIEIPEFDSKHTRAQNNIALMRLAKPMLLNDGIHEAIGLKKIFPTQGSEAVVAGYGVKKSSVPRQRSVTLQNCDDGPLCSYSGGRTKFGKSGPVVLNGELVGIVSDSKTLKGKSRMYEEHYAAIAFHYYWILSVIETDTKLGSSVVYDYMLADGSECCSCR